MFLTDLDVFNIHRNIKYVFVGINILNGHQHNHATNIRPRHRYSRIGYFIKCLTAWFCHLFRAKILNKLSFKIFKLIKFLVKKINIYIWPFSLGNFHSSTPKIELQRVLTDQLACEHSFDWVLPSGTSIPSDFCYNLPLTIFNRLINCGLNFLFGWFRVFNFHSENLYDEKESAMYHLC